jgi:hypothetical protein
LSHLSYLLSTCLSLCLVLSRGSWGGWSSCGGWSCRFNIVFSQNTSDHGLSVGTWSNRNKRSCNLIRSCLSEQLRLWSASVNLGLEVSLNICLKILHINTVGSSISRRKHSCSRRVLGLFKCLLLGLLLLLLEPQSLFFLVLLNHGLIVPLGLLKLLSFSFLGLLFFLGESLWGSCLFNHSTENTLLPLVAINSNCTSVVYAK